MKLNSQTLDALDSIKCDMFTLGSEQQRNNIVVAPHVAPLSALYCFDTISWVFHWVYPAPFDDFDSHPRCLYWYHNVEVVDIVVQVEFGHILPIENGLISTQLISASLVSSEIPACLDEPTHEWILNHVHLQLV